jgi:hypothetical protein
MYYLMYAEFAEPLLAKNPHSVPYDGVKLLLSGSYPIGFEGIENRICDLGFNPTEDVEQTGLTTTQLISIVDALRAKEPNNNMAVVSREQGKWLYANHPAFIPPVGVEP